MGGAPTYGLRQIGVDEMVAAQGWMLDLARHHDPATLFEHIRKFRNALFPDRLEKAWRDGMDKEDIQVEPVPDGYHVAGFLNPVTGAKFKTVLDSVSAPRDKDDTRTGSERRIQGLDDLMTSVLESGLPSDKGIRPHVSVVVDADTLADAAAHVEAETTGAEPPPAPQTPTDPATLTGYGAIGPNLLMYFACISDFTAFLMTTDGGTRQADVLNVGRTRRTATLKQRRAVITRQHGTCAAPGCRHTHLEIHHTIWWSHGGPTDLDLLVGLCTRCHHLLHRGLLNITGTAKDGFEFTNRTGTPLGRRRRTSYRQAA